MTYKNQLKDKRWIDIQNFVKKRDEYTCQLCGKKDTFLHVHNLVFKPSTKLWEYDTNSFASLCDDCYNSANTTLPKIILLAISHLVKQGANIFDIQKYLEEKTNVKLTDNEVF